MKKILNVKYLAENVFIYFQVSETCTNLLL